LLFLAAAAYGVLRAQTQTPTEAHESVLERCQRADDVTLRFYYNPTINEPNFSPGPVIFLPVSSQDPRLGTRPGWSLYITLADLRDVLHVLADSHPEWKESDSPKQLVVDPFALPQPHHTSMEVAVSCPTGSATAQVDARRICTLLSQVYGALNNAKARQAFAHWTGNVNCVVMKAEQSSTK
jgi:hypothetical protein